MNKQLDARRKGGIKGGKTKTENTKFRGFGRPGLTEEERKEFSRKGVEARRAKKEAQLRQAGKEISSQGI